LGSGKEVAKAKLLNAAPKINAVDTTAAAAAAAGDSDAAFKNLRFVKANKGNEAEHFLLLLL
jgi:hypothetical protein